MPCSRAVAGVINPTCFEGGGRLEYLEEAQTWERHAERGTAGTGFEPGTFLLWGTIPPKTRGTCHKFAYQLGKGFLKTTLPQHTADCQTEMLLTNQLLIDNYKKGLIKNSQKFTSEHLHQWRKSLHWHVVSCSWRQSYCVFLRGFHHSRTLISTDFHIYSV